MQKRGNYLSRRMIAFLCCLLLLSSSVMAIDVAADVNGFFFPKFVNANSTNSDEYIPENFSSLNSAFEIDALNYTMINTDSYSILVDYEGKMGNSLLLGENSVVTYTFSLQQEGYYQLYLDYFPVTGTGASIRRKFSLDGGELFSVEFERSYTYADEIRRDELDNDLKPKLVEKTRWLTKRIVSESLAEKENDLGGFFCTAGEHTLQISYVDEPLVLHRIRLIPCETIVSYAELEKDYVAQGYSLGASIRQIEAERPAYTSSPTLSPLTDRTSPSTSPASASSIRYNTIGGDRWKTVGEWIEWTITVPESGLYYLGLRWRQELKTNDISYRCLYIDNQLPFAEAAAIPFHYDTNWKISRIGESSERPEGYRFYLEKGVHLIRLEVTLGEQAEIRSKMEKSILALNEIYREIVMVTGPSPDLDRDYQFDRMIPDTIKKIEQQAAEIQEIEKDIISNTNSQGGQNVSTLRRLSLQLTRMAKDDTIIAGALSEFQNNISSMGTMLLSASEQPLEIDYFLLDGEGGELPKAEADFFSRVKFFLEQFIYSFLTDYDAIGQSGDVKESVVVWVGSSGGMTGGRDQAQILKQMARDSFTTREGIRVNLQLVAGGSLLPATLAGLGPDVALSMAQGEPMNYAFRNAVYNLGEFDDFDEVAKRFYDSALHPFRYQSEVYALPETQSFPMLFYRKDILDESGVLLEDLDTWDGILQVVLPKLQNSYLEFGLLPSINSYGMFLLQENGNF